LQGVESEGIARDAQRGCWLLNMTGAKRGDAVGG
jgi:hypothetical protein